MRGEGADTDVIVIDVVNAHASVVVLKKIRRRKEVIELQFGVEELHWNISAGLHSPPAVLSQARVSRFLSLPSVTKPVGEVLRDIREASGRPRSEIARAAKLEPSVLWRLENPEDGAQPSLDLVRRVAAALGVSLDDVSGGVERRQRLAVPSPENRIDRIRLTIDELAHSFEPSSRKPKKGRCSGRSRNILAI